LYSISGVQGYSHLYNGNEETISWSVSHNLVDWDFRGHVLHASLRDSEFDQHEAWSPFALAAKGRYYLFYTGVRHPVRPLCHEKLGQDHPQSIWTGHKETIGLAVSDNLTAWVKISDREKGLAVPGRDPHVVYDDEKNRWLLYSTGSCKDGLCDEYVSQSYDLLNWETIGICARFPLDEFPYSTTESMTVIRHPLNNHWLLLGNWQYALSDNPTDFTKSTVHRYFAAHPEQKEFLGDLGFAGEIIEWDGKWYRSGVLGVVDYWVLGFHEIVWEADGAFLIRTPSRVRCQLT
jgi:sucrose-6-phosphate hydrolase SacC (GH32 family)